MANAGVTLTRSTSFNAPNNTGLAVTFDTATAFGGAVAGDYFDAGTDATKLVLPASGGSTFMCGFSAYTTSSTSDDNRIGIALLGATYASVTPRATTIMSRSGVTPRLPWVDGQEIQLSLRPYFNASSISYPANLTQLTVLVDPVPIAIATNKKADLDSVTEPATATVFEPTVAKLNDPYSIYSGSGVFTAPAGTVAFEVNFNVFGDPTDTTNYLSYVRKNGTDVVRFTHPGSLRSPTFSSSGILPASAGDEISIAHNGTASRTLSDISYSVTFY